MRKPDLCTHCGAILPEARLVVHHPGGVSGKFCVVDKSCFEFAFAKAAAVNSSALHADLETIERVEPLLPVPNRMSA